LYQEKGELRQHETTVKDIERLNDGSSNPDGTEASYAVFLDETIFHVRGGGQPFDLGTIAGSDSIIFEVKGVNHDSQNRVAHTGSFKIEGDPAFKPGDRVKIDIDSARRLLNSRLHTAGHILGAATMSLSREGKLPELQETKANHAPESASVEFRGLIDGKFKDIIQERADEFVKASIPVKIHFWGRQECEAKGITQLPEKVGKDEETVFRVIEIAGKESYPCGGTHVSDTSGVGRVIVKRISRQKGISKVSYTVS
jgi:Ser-tRNA(Ala) deacylase AlaX